MKVAKVILSILIAPLCFAACHKTNEHACQPAAAVTDLRFRIFDATTGVDLLYTSQPNRIFMDSVTAFQSCFAGHQGLTFDRYIVPGTTQVGYTFAFTNLRNPGTSEADSCFTILVHWSPSDSSTIHWHYHPVQQSGCTVQLIDFVSIDSTQATQIFDGIYTYWALYK